MVFTNNNSAYSVAADLAQTGIEVAAIIDSRDTVPDAARAMVSGIEILPGHVVTTTQGGRHIRSVEVAPNGGGAIRRIACDLLAMSGGWNPAVHLWSQSRGTLRYDNALTSFVPDHAAQAAISVGAANGN